MGHRLQPEQETEKRADSGDGIVGFWNVADAGAAAIFPPGTVIADAAVELLERLDASR